MDDFIVLSDERGGNVLRHIYRWWKMRKAADVFITGKCYSSATIFLSLPGAVVSEDADIGFHGMGIGKIPLPFFAMFVLAPFYKRGIRGPFIRRWQFIPPSRIHRISGSDYIKLTGEA